MASRENLTTASIEGGEASIAAERPQSRVGAFIEDLKGRGKEWVESKWDDISAKTGEWKDRIVETVKMNTVDKWGMMATNWNDNRLVNQKEGDIKRQEGRVAKIEDKIKEEQGKKNQEGATFDTALSKVKSEEMRALFQRTKDEKLGALQADIDKVEEKAVKAREKGDDLKAGLENFKQGVETTKKGFNTKIDDAINTIKERGNYESCVEDRKELRRGIERGKELIETNELQIADYKEALKHKDLLSKEDRNGIRAELNKYEESLKKAKAYVKETEEKSAKLSKHIASVERKVDSWNTFREKYAKKAPAESAPQTVNSGSGAVETSSGSSGYESLDREKVLERLAKNTGELDEALVDPNTSTHKLMSVVGEIQTTLRSADTYLEGDEAKAALAAKEVADNLMNGGSKNESVVRKGALMLYRRLIPFYQEAALT